MAVLALLHKELLEAWRTRRLLVLAAVFLLFGLLAPITAKLTPELLKLVGESAPGVVIQAPIPTSSDAVAQYVKNLSQILPLVVLLVSMGAVSGEKERGTLPMVVAKPVGRGAVLGCKFAVLALTVLAALGLGAVAAYYYTVILFGGLDVGGFVALNVIAGLYLLVVAALTFLASTLASGTPPAGVLAFGFWLVLVVLSALPEVGRWSPAALPAWAAEVGLGIQGTAAWPAVGVSALLIAAALGLALLAFRRHEF